MKHLPNSNQKGQALLIVLLGMAVALTMVLSVVSRSVTDIQLTSSDEESLRAFSAAEAGVEKALLTGSAESGELGTGIGYSAEITEFAEGGLEYIVPGEFKSGESATIWFVSHDENGNFICQNPNNPCVYDDWISPFTSMNVCWGKSGDSGPKPAIEITVYYDSTISSLGANPNYSNVRIARMVFDPDDSRIIDNQFTADSGACLYNSSFLYQTGPRQFRNGSAYSIPAADIDTAGNLLFAKIKFIYNNTFAHPVTIMMNKYNMLPAQGTFINSTGISGESQRKVEVFKSYREPLSIFESAVFSVGPSASLEKN